MSDNITNELGGWSDILWQATGELTSTLAQALPSILKALVLLIFAVIVAKIFKMITYRVVKLIGFNKIAEVVGIQSYLEKNDKTDIFLTLIPKMVYWVIFLIFLPSITDALGIAAVGESIHSFLGYLPNVIGAVIIFTCAMAGANIVGKFIQESLNAYGSAIYSKVVSNIARGVIFLFGAIIAIDLLGFDTTIITANATVIIIGAVAALALSFGLGSRDLMSNLVAGYYLKQNLPAGASFTYQGIDYTVVEVRSVVTYLQSGDKTHLMPNKELLSTN